MLCPRVLLLDTWVCTYRLVKVCTMSCSVTDSEPRTVVLGIWTPRAVSERQIFSEFLITYVLPPHVMICVSIAED